MTSIFKIGTNVVDKYLKILFQGTKLPFISKCGDKAQNTAIAKLTKKDRLSRFIPFISFLPTARVT